MGNKRKITVVITARPSYSRIKTLLTAIKESSKLELSIIVGGSALLQKFGKTVKQIEEDGFNVDALVNYAIEGNTPETTSKSTGMAIVEITSAFSALKPNLVITIADRFETIATAIAASYMNIPLAHIQGGEISGNIDEKVRHAVTKLADLHFTASHESYNRVIQMGEIPTNVYNTGCPSIDLASGVYESKKDIVLKDVGGVGANFKLNNDYLIVMQHPVTTEYGRGSLQIQETLSAIIELGIKTMWFWPNIDAGSNDISKELRKYREQNPRQDFIHFFTSLPPEDFLILLKNSLAIVGNSSVGIREASFLGVPNINIGTRQSGRERAINTIDVDYNSSEIMKAVNQFKDFHRFVSSEIYGDGNSGKRISDILEIAQYSSEKKFYVS